MIRNKTKFQNIIDWIFYKNYYLLDKLFSYAEVEHIL